MYRRTCPNQRSKPTNTSASEDDIDHAYQPSVGVLTIEGNEAWDRIEYAQDHQYDAYLQYFALWALNCMCGPHPGDDRHCGNQHNHGKRLEPHSKRDHLCRLADEVCFQPRKLTFINRAAIKKRFQLFQLFKVTCAVAGGRMCAL